MNSIINYFKSWTLSRYFRLAAGLLIIFYGIDSEQYMYFIVAGWFLLQALLNFSCCGAGGCNTNVKPSKNEEKDDGNNILVTYKEIK